MQEAVAVVIMGIALLGLWGICRESVLLARLRQNGITTTGTVTRHLPRSDSVDRPVIQFTDRHGRQIEYSPSWGTQKKYVPLGNQISVVYLANAPHKARLAGSETRRSSLVPLAVLCAVFLAFGLLLMTGALPQSSQEPTVESDSPKEWLFALAIIVPGALMVGHDIYRIRSLLAMRREGIATMGTVVRVFGKSDGEERRAVVEFFDSSHRRIQFIIRSPSRSATAGTQVSVIYQPDSPEGARLASSSSIIRSLLSGILIFLVTVAAGGFIIFT